MNLLEEALDYHSRTRRGKIEVIPTKPCRTQYDLSLAYTPGVAEPCRRIQSNPDDAYTYTARENLVAVISNGTAVLGLGNIGPLAGKPVMEGKAVLFKRFADVDVFDLEVNALNPDELIQVCKALEPTFGGINLEDIAAPDCFYVEETLKASLSIPVFHDDQHGTAIISGAALLNAIELTGKNIADIRVVFSGAGASGIACARMYESLGVRHENVLLVDTKGVLYHGRDDLDSSHPRYNKYKAYFSQDTERRTLADALKDADVFCGCSVANVVTKEMVRSMAADPIVFAMANPDPEISYPQAREARHDVIVATGRSDYPNQVNNVLGFPFIFRGALDTHARQINETMKLAAAHSLAALAKEDVPDYVCQAYGVDRIQFGRDYLIPKPIDHRVLLFEAVAVARAAVESGVARKQISDFTAYRDQLEALLGHGREITRMFINRAKMAPRRIIFPEGEEPKILRAAQAIVEEKIGRPMLIGDKDIIDRKRAELGLNFNGDVDVIDPLSIPAHDISRYVEELWQLRQRKGITRNEARKLLHDNNYLATMLVKDGRADALVAGVSQHYSDTIRPALQILSKEPGVRNVSALHALVFKERTVFLADSAVNVDANSAEDLAEIAILAADTVKRCFAVIPRVAMLSFSNFGSVSHPLAEKMRAATILVHNRRPDIIIDGEMQADVALDAKIAAETYPFMTLQNNSANTLIFPDMTSANIAVKLLMKLGNAEAIGPILMGMGKSVHVLQRDCDVNAIVQAAAYSVVDVKYH